MTGARIFCGGRWLVVDVRGLGLAHGRILGQRNSELYRVSVGVRQDLALDRRTTGGMIDECGSDQDERRGVNSVQDKVGAG